MKDYVMWLGEKLSKIYTKKTWDELMQMVTSNTFKPEDHGLSLHMYLQERKDGVW